MTTTTTTTNPTTEVLISMLKENTGRAMLDSGDHYGRNWQRNALKDFFRESRSWIDARVTGDGELDLSVTHSVYHWLADKLDFAPDMDRKLQKFCALHPDDSWFQNVADFAALMEKRGATGIYGDGAPITVNSYNGEDLLSQVIQYVYFEHDGESFVLLSIHGGCDVRGGYTRPRAFTCSNELSIFDNARAVLWPDVPAIVRYQQKLPGMESAPDAPTWETDDGYHWRTDGYSRADLRDYPASTNPDDKGTGVVVVDDDGNIYCPLSGFRLIPDFY